MSRTRAKSYPSNIAKILDSILGRKSLRKKIGDCRVFAVWDDVVGDGIARHTEPVSLRKGVLKVVVTDHGWLQQLQFLKEDIRKRLNQRADSDIVNNIYFQFGVVRERVNGDKHNIAGELRKVSLAKSEEEKIDEALKGIKDIGIRESIRRVMVKEAKRKKLEVKEG